MNQDAEGKKCEPVGTLYEKGGPMFFREAQGTADGPDGPVYEFSTNVSGGHPILRHLGTGRTFTLGWRDIIELAEANGIAEPDAGMEAALEEERCEMLDRESGAMEQRHADEA